MAAQKSGTGRKLTTAELADKYIYYEQSVQCPESEIDFVSTTFTKIRRRRAKVLREDFCGTANTACEWVKRNNDNVAIAVDLDDDVLGWSKRNKIVQLSPKQVSRITFVRGDVTVVKTDPADIILAMNFSYWLLKTRHLMSQYFKKTYAALADDGIFFLDAYGGYEAFQEITDKVKHKDFTYIWEQRKYSPVTGIADNYIHFKFKDGSKLEEAFYYSWRVWTLPEILEILGEVGFKATVYWEQTDEHGEEGNGVFVPEQEGEADASWIVYIVAEK